MYFVIITTLIAFYITLCIFLLDAKDMNAEKIFLRNIKEFLERENQVLHELKEFQNYIQAIHSKAEEDEDDVNNPYSEFLIAKRIIMDWHYIITMTNQRKQHLEELDLNFDKMIKNSSITLRNLKDTVLTIANIQEKLGSYSVNEFLMTLTSDPDTKLTASDFGIFSQVLKTFNKDTLAERWKTQGQIFQFFNEDPLLELYDYQWLDDQLKKAEERVQKLKKD